MWCSVVWCNPHSLCSVSHATRTGCDGHVQIDLPSLLCELVQQRNVTQGSVVASVHMHLLLLWTFTQCFGFEPHTKWLYLTSWIHIVTLFHLHEVEKPLHWFTESNWDVSHVGVLHNFFLYFILPHDSPPTPYWIHVFFRVITSTLYSFFFLSLFCDFYMINIFKCEFSPHDSFPHDSPPHDSLIVMNFSQMTDLYKFFGAPSRVKKINK